MLGVVVRIHDQLVYLAKMKANLGCDIDSYGVNQPWKLREHELTLHAATLLAATPPLTSLGTGELSYTSRRRSRMLTRVPLPPSVAIRAHHMLVLRISSCIKCITCPASSSTFLSSGSTSPCSSSLVAPRLFLNHRRAIGESRQDVSAPTVLVSVRIPITLPTSLA